MGEPLHAWFMLLLLVQGAQASDKRLLALYDNRGSGNPAPKGVGHDDGPCDFQESNGGVLSATPPRFRDPLRVYMQGVVGHAVQWLLPIAPCPGWE